jgi:hypothetical protein
MSEVKLTGEYHADVNLLTGELAALREERGRLDSSLSCMSGHVLAYKLSRQRLLGRARERELQILNLQHRLADAERRNSLLEWLIHRALFAEVNDGYVDRFAAKEELRAALTKPEEAKS